MYMTGFKGGEVLVTETVRAWDLPDHLLVHVTAHSALFTNLSTSY